jgi:alpha-mannosidase
MYCAIRRKIKPGNPADAARYEKVMQQYVDASTPSREWGITILNEGKYAFDTRDGGINITMHGSPAYPSPANKSWAIIEREQRKTRGDEGEPPKYIGLHPINCRYALYPHAGGALVDQGGIPEPVAKVAAMKYNFPMIVRKITDLPSKISPDYHSFEINAPKNIQMTTFKKKEWESTESIIIRLAEISGVPMKDARIKFPRWFLSKIRKIVPTDLLERPIERHFDWNAETGVLTTDFNKFEVHGFEISLVMNG